MNDAQKLDCIALKRELALAWHEKLAAMTSDERLAHWLEVEERMLARQAAARATQDLAGKPEDRPDPIGC